MYGLLLQVIRTITTLGEAIITFVVNPFGVAILIIGSIALAIRGLTGSWEFLTVPMKGAWQAFKDIIVVGTEWAGIIIQRLKPDIEEFISVISKAANVLAGPFTSSLDDVRRGLYRVWDTIKQQPSMQHFLGDLKRLNEEGR